MSKAKKKSWGLFFPEYELRRRETGFKRKIGWEENLKYKLYSSLHPCNSWDPIINYGNEINFVPAHHGGIFNLEFSPDGKQLVAACERKAIIIFDPLSRRLIHNVEQAHLSCVNGIKFLDNRVFASCSDDKTVALWDVRNLKRKIKSLCGHNNWVKNVEYSCGDGLLVTSGFDGKILGWNINRYSEENGQYTELFKMQGLMRIKFTPDFNKLIICTTGGYMLMVHNLSLLDLPKDLKGFKPNDFRHLQMSDDSDDSYMHGKDFKNYFERHRNRLEFINDFPPENIAEVIHSLQVHPQAWCVLSRNTSVHDLSEWTCVHDIQELISEKEEDNIPARVKSKPNIISENDSVNCPLEIAVNPRVEIMLRQNFVVDTQEEEESDEILREAENEQPSENSNVGLPAGFNPIDVVQVIERYDRIRRELQISSNNDHVGEEPLEENLNSTTNASSNRQVNENSTTSRNQDFRLRQRRRRLEGSLERHEDFRNIFVVRPDIHSNRTLLLINCYNRLNGNNTQDPQKLDKNISRLTNFIEEPNKGKGFIKELCFSSDGRLICSPFDCGVRLMMFNDKCSELSHCIQKEPQQLRVISSNICHSNCVVSTKFSPVDCLLVSGCLNGKIVWHQPLL